jgi:hypothetical protein
MLTLYPVAFGLKFYTNIVVSLEKNKLGDEKFWDLVIHLKPEDIDGQTSVYQAFYWLNSGLLN